MGTMDIPNKVHECPRCHDRWQGQAYFIEYDFAIGMSGNVPITCSAGLCKKCCTEIVSHAVDKGFPVENVVDGWWYHVRKHPEDSHESKRNHK